MSQKVAALSALEILDSRGNPTLRVEMRLESGIKASASVPSGASTGAREARELRDGDPTRYGGKGVLKAINHVANRLGPRLIGLDITRQAEIDSLLKEIDGTQDKSALGANALLGVSMAAARAAACACGLPLYSHLSGGEAHRLPLPMMNVINGGRHADSGLDFQEFMIVPSGAPSFAEALRYGAETYHALGELLRERGYSTAVGDEGGYAPKLQGNEEACEFILAAIERAGYTPGNHIALALDPAATSFFVNRRYRLRAHDRGGKSTQEMISLYEGLAARFPIRSIEDGLAEDDWQGFQEMTARMGERLQIVGDDILVTNPTLIRRAIAEHTCNAALIKLNQIGTVTETIEAIQLCRDAGWGFVISHRSGETEDTFIADFAVAMNAAQIKTGAPCRSERVAKYNRLLEIEAALGHRAAFGA